MTGDLHTDKETDGRSEWPQHSPRLYAMRRVAKTAISTLGL